MYRRALSDQLALAAEQKKDEKEYWLSQLSGEIIKSSFPFDFVKKNRTQRVIEAISFEFPAQLVQRLMKITNHSDIRLNIMLIAAVMVLIEKYTGNGDIIVGTPIYKQESDVDFINTVLVIRQQVPPHAAFKELVLSVGQVIMQGIKNQNYPMERLLYHLNISYSPQDDFPLFDVAVLLENIHDRQYIYGLFFLERR
jgi:hypothetical protein